MTAAQQEVLEVLRTTGPAPDVVLVPVVQHLGRLHQSSSGIRTRRAELANQAKVLPAGVVTIKGRKHQKWVAA